MRVIYTFFTVLDCMFEYFAYMSVVDYHQSPFRLGSSEEELTKKQAPESEDVWMYIEKNSCLVIIHYYVRDLTDPSIVDII